jgi:2-keto-3-deoxy-L-fuconate dehydrogenase
LILDAIRCNCISPEQVHIPFVDGFISRNHPRREREMFEKLGKSQRIGRMANRRGSGRLGAVSVFGTRLYFLTGVDYPIDGGFMNRRG